LEVPPHATGRGWGARGRFLQATSWGRSLPDRSQTPRRPRANSRHVATPPLQQSKRTYAPVASQTPGIQHQATGLSQGVDLRHGRHHLRLGHPDLDSECRPLHVRVFY
jgi:hypothetical protein